MGTEGGRRTDGARRARMEENRRMILAGEIGATRTRLAAFETQGNKLQQVVEKIYMSQEHGGLPEIISDFIRTEGIPVQSACFGVAGPVRAGSSKISNLPWIIDSHELGRQLKLNSVGLINDLEAYAYGIDALESKDFIALSEGSEDAEGNRALISQIALENKSSICDRTLSIFVSIYGAETGNCALHFMATGGIFIGGSIAAKIVPKMKDPIFMQSFLNKGRMEPLLKEMPVKIVLNDDSGIIGAARYTLVQKAFRNANRA